MNDDNNNNNNKSIVIIIKVILYVISINICQQIIIKKNKLYVDKDKNIDKSTLNNIQATNNDVTDNQIDLKDNDLSRKDDNDLSHNHHHHQQHHHPPLLLTTLKNKAISSLSITDKSFSLLQYISNKKTINSNNNNNIIIIGIAGGSGSGKTTLTTAIYESIGINNITYISHYSYYKDLSHLSISERSQQNFDHPDSLDTDLLIEHIKLLKDNISVVIPTYDYNTHTRVKPLSSSSSSSSSSPTEIIKSNEDNIEIITTAKSIILVEGILIFTNSNLYNLFDMKIYVDTDDDIRLIRRLQRDVKDRGRTIDSIILQYLTTVRPMHIQYVEPSKKNADIIVPIGLNSVVLDLVVSKLKSHLLLVSNGL